MSRHTAIQSAETLAALRALADKDTRLDVPCRDRFAKHFLGFKNRLLLELLPQTVLQAFVGRITPGSYPFAIARTRHFDEALLSGLRAGVRQVVILGAGYDSRPFRFAKELENIRVFELDHPGTQARKRAFLGKAVASVPQNLTLIGIDFTQTSFRDALAEHGFSPALKTLFLWEGVSYYLPAAAVSDVLAFVGDCAPGSSIVLDYALRSFVEGDTSTYGGREIARWLDKIGEPFLFGLDPAEASAFLARHNLRVVSHVGPAELEQLYLTTTDNRSPAKTLGHVRIVQAERAADTIDG